MTATTLPDAFFSMTPAQLREERQKLCQKRHTLRMTSTRQDYDPRIMYVSQQIDDVDRILGVPLIG